MLEFISSMSALLLVGFFGYNSLIRIIKIIRADNAAQIAKAKRKFKRGGKLPD